MRDLQMNPNSNWMINKLLYFGISVTKTAEKERVRETVYVKQRFRTNEEKMSGWMHRAYHNLIFDRTVSQIKLLPFVSQMHPDSVSDGTQHGAQWQKQMHLQKKRRLSSPVESDSFVYQESKRLLNQRPLRSTEEWRVPGRPSIVVPTEFDDLKRQIIVRRRFCSHSTDLPITTTCFSRFLTVTK